MGFPLPEECFPDKLCWVEPLGALGRLFCSAIPFQERHRGLSLAELCRGDSQCAELRAPGARTRLKSLKWNSLKMASLPSTSFHPTALRFGSSCSLSSVLSLWALPAWRGKRSRSVWQKWDEADVGSNEASHGLGSCSCGVGGRVGMSVSSAPCLEYILHVPRKSSWSPLSSHLQHLPWCLRY